MRPRPMAAARRRPLPPVLRSSALLISTAPAPRARLTSPPFLRHGLPTSRVKPSPPLSIRAGASLLSTSASYNNSSSPLTPTVAKAALNRSPELRLIHTTAFHGCPQPCPTSHILLPEHPASLLLLGPRR